MVPTAPQLPTRPIHHAATALIVGLMLTACGAGPTSVEPIVDQCPAEGVSVQVLGSGGPEGLPGRAGPSYVVRVDGKARVVIEAGAGAFTRFKASGARLDDVEALLISQLGVSHVADVAPMLESMRLSKRNRPLAIVGPGGAAGYPSIAVWLQQLIGARGVFPDKAGLLAPGDPYRIAINDVTIDAGTPRLVYAEGGLEVLAVGVPHGEIPSVGYLIQIGGRRLAFSGDQRADDPRFLTMIRGADLLVAHLAAVEDSPPSIGQLHARPTLIGALAKAARVKRLVLSRLSPQSLARQAESLERIGDRYDGAVSVAADLDCIPIPAPTPATPADG